MFANSRCLGYDNTDSSSLFLVTFKPVVQLLLDPASPSTPLSFVMVILNELLLFAFLASACLRLLIRIRLLASFTLLTLGVISRFLVVVVVLDGGLLHTQKDKKKGIW